MKTLPKNYTGRNKFNFDYSKFQIMIFFHKFDKICNHENFSQSYSELNSLDKN